MAHSFLYHMSDYHGIAIW